MFRVYRSNTASSLRRYFRTRRRDRAANLHIVHPVQVKVPGDVKV